MRPEPDVILREFKITVLKEKGNKTARKRSETNSVHRELSLLYFCSNFFYSIQRWWLYYDKETTKNKKILLNNDTHKNSCSFFFFFTNFQITILYLFI